MIEPGRYTHKAKETERTMKYTYRKSEGEEIWTVGHDDNGEWIPESDWSGEKYASMRAAFLNTESRQSPIITAIRKRIEEMHEGYRKEAVAPTSNYHRGAADACANILDLPELRLFLPAKGEVE